MGGRATGSRYSQEATMIVHKLQELHMVPGMKLGVFSMVLANLGCLKAGS